MLTQNDIETQLTQAKLDIANLQLQRNQLQASINNLQQQINGLNTTATSNGSTNTTSSSSLIGIMNGIGPSIIVTIISLFRSLASFFGKVLINSNSSTAPVSPGSQSLQIVGVDNTQDGIVINTFNQSANLTSYRANNTNASKTAVALNNILGSILAEGYDGTAYSNSAALLRFYAGENWSGTAHGTYIKFYTTPNTTVTPAVALTIFGSGGIGIGASVSDPGINNLTVDGDINVADIIASGNLSGVDITASGYVDSAGYKAGGTPGVNGALTLSPSTSAITVNLTVGTTNVVVSVTPSTVNLQYKDWTGSNQTQTIVTAITVGTTSVVNGVSVASTGPASVLTNVTLTSNNFTDGLRTT